MTYATGGRPTLGARNSLDYWNKSEDWQGVTTYYRGGPVPRSPYGMENIYVQSPTSRHQRPAPFPLNLPVSKPGVQELRRVPAPRSPSAPEPGTGTYQNVPVMPRVRMPETVIRKPSPPKDSPIFPVKQQTPDSLIWSVSSHSHHHNHVAPISNSPQITRVEVRPSNTMVSDKRQSPRQKPKWGRFMRTLCCCVAPEGKTEKLNPVPPSNPGLLITQVQKNGSNYPEVSTYQRPQAIIHTSDEKSTANDYTPTPAQQSPLPKNGERHLLPQLRPADAHKKCLIIDLDETLVHSSFKPVKNADFVIPVEIDGVEHKVYVLKRPYVDEFLERVGDRFECVLFTASLAKYADPVADLLDKKGVFRARLFREACVYHKGNYVKDLARLGRDLHKVIIIDNSPASYAFHPENAIPVQTWFDDPTDCELLEIIPFLERMERLESVYHATRASESPSDILLSHS